ncbi:TPA: hypothetical protein ACX3CS_004867 [Vibrio parahaemolyticus]
MADKNKKPMWLFEEQPDVRFFGLRLVKFVSVIFGGVFLFTFCVTLSDTATLDWKLDVEGLKFFFLDAMKVPGSILAFYLAVLGLIGANHRSEQTKKQISATGEQNRFANYFKHLEEFKKHVEGLEQKYLIDMTKIRMIHDNMFPRAYDFGEYDVARGQLELMCDLLETIGAFLTKVETKDDLLSIPGEFDDLIRLRSKFGIQSDSLLKRVREKDESIDNRVNLFNTVIADIIGFSNIVRDLVAFSNDTVWEHKYRKLASDIERERISMRDKFRQADSLRKARKDISDMFGDAGAE